MHPGKVRAGSDEILAEINIRIMIKRILFLLLFPVVLFGQTVEKVVKTTSTAAGAVVWKPSDYDATKSYPLVVFCAGIASRGGGTTTSLDLLLKGEVPLNIQRACEKYKFILIAPQTNDNYDSEIDFARNYAMSKYRIDVEHMGLFGFSLGGGDIVRYSLQPANANKFSCIVPIAMTQQSGTWSNISNQKLATWFFHNLNDDNGGTLSKFTDSAVAQINRTNPLVKATKTIFNANSHGGTAEALNPDAPPIAPNGFGLTNPTLNTYEWFLTTSESNPIAPPGAVAPSGLVANGKITLSGDIAFLDGTPSFNYKSATWQTVSVPVGVNFWAVSACGWVTCSVKLPATGTYVFRLTVKDASGAATTTDVQVNYSNAPPVPPGPVPNPVKKVKYRIIVYDDGSIEVVPEGTTSTPPPTPTGKQLLAIKPAQVFDGSQARKTPELLFDGDTTTMAFGDYFNGYILDAAGGQYIWVVLDDYVNNASIDLFNGRWAYGGQVDFQLYYDITDTSRKSQVFSTTLPSLEWKTLDIPWNDSARLLKIRVADGGSINFAEVKVRASKLGPAPSFLPPSLPGPADEGRYFMGYNKLSIDTSTDEAGGSQRNINDLGFIHPDETSGKKIYINRFSNSIEATYLPAQRNGRKSHLAGAGPREGYKYPPHFTNDSKDMPHGADSTKPEAWQSVYNTYYGLAAKMGSNKNADVAGITYFNTPPGVGLGVTTEFEVGNEDDARWAGLLRFHNARVKLQKLRAGYLGIKAADPNMKVISGATTGIDTNYLKAMYFTRRLLKWSYDPFDIIAVNEYATNSGGQHLGNSDGVSPEEFKLYEKLTGLVKVRDRYFPGKPVYITEIGYDVHDGSNYDVPVIAGQTREQTKAYWGLRSFEIGAASGISRMYWYTAEQGLGGDFSTTGFTVPANVPKDSVLPKYLDPFRKQGGGWTTLPVDLYWYMTCRMLVLKDYKAKADTIKVGGTTGVWMLKYYHVSDSRKNIISIWLGTSNNTVLNNYAVSVGGPATLTTPTVGIKQGNKSVLNVSGGSVWITVTESPQYIEITT